MAKQKRSVFHSVPSKDAWKVTLNKKTVSNHETQKDAENAAKTLGRNTEMNGGLGQAVLHKKDGSIREERTYGADPRKTPG
ncbi:MAG: DUF2188 domain-containing protein [Luteibacter sp.]